VSPPGERYVAASFSPDGRHLALVAEGRQAIDLCDPEGDGTAVRRLVAAPRAGSRFAWTADSAAIVHREGDRRLTRTALAGGRTIVAEADGAVGFPAIDDRGQVRFSAQGRLRSTGPERGAVIAHGGLVTVTAAAAPLAAGWDGDHIFVVDLTTGARRTLFDGFGFFDIELTADGRLALVRESRGREGHLWLAATDGSWRRDLGVGWFGRLAPDGRGVVFVLQENDGVRFTAADLYYVDLGGRRVRLTETTERLEIEPAFAPGGDRLAYVDAATGRVHVARVVSEEVAP